MRCFKLRGNCLSQFFFKEHAVTLPCGLCFVMPLVKVKNFVQKGKISLPSFNLQTCLDFAPYLILHKTVPCVFQLSKKGLDYLITFKKKLVEHFCCIIRQLRKISIVYLLPFLSSFPFSRTDQPTHFSGSPTYLSLISRSLPCQNSSLL